MDKKQNYMTVPAAMKELEKIDGSQKKKVTDGVRWQPDRDISLRVKKCRKLRFIFEFKVKNADDDGSILADTLNNALAQIEEKQYAQNLIALGIRAEHI